MFTILIENSLDYKGLLFLIAPVNILLFLEFFYLKSKSDDFINFNSVIIRSIRKNNIGESNLSSTLLSLILLIITLLELMKSSLLDSR